MADGYLAPQHIKNQSKNKCSSKQAASAVQSKGLLTERNKKSSSPLESRKRTVETHKEEENEEKIELKETLSNILTVLKSIKEQLDKSLSNQQEILHELKLQIAVTASFSSSKPKSVSYNSGFLSSMSSYKDRDNNDDEWNCGYDYD